MSSLTYEQAVDEILGLFKTAWDTTGYDAYYEDVRDTKTTSKEPWCSVVVRHASGNQATLGGTGSRLFRRTGTVIIAIHTPSGNGLSASLALAKVAADAYEGVSSNGVWFRNVRVNEEGKVRTGWFQTNVLADFEYDERK